MSIVLDGTNASSFSGGITKPSLPTGSVLQVVQGVYTTETTSASSTYTDTGLTATITPTSATSKILVIAQLSGVGKYTGNTQMRTKVLKNGTDLFFMDIGAGYTASTAANNVGSINSNYLDSPASTSALTYKVQFCSSSNIGTVAINNTAGAEAPTSSITLMEIAA